MLGKLGKAGRDIPKYAGLDSAFGTYRVRGKKNGWFHVGEKRRGLLQDEGGKTKRREN